MGIAALLVAMAQASTSEPTATLARQQVAEPPRLEAGVAIEGEIADGDPIVRTPSLDATRAFAPTVGKRFRVEVDEPGPWTIELRSRFFDSYLVLRDADGNVVAEDDDGLVFIHARIVVERLEPGRRYVVEAGALHGERGPFRLQLARGRPEPMTPSERRRLGEEEARAAVEEVEAADGEESGRYLNAMGRLVRLLMREGRLAEARPLAERELAINEKMHGLEHPTTATYANNLAVILERTGDYAGARRLYERALEIHRRTSGPRSREVSPALGNLAHVLFLQGDYAGAEPISELALAITEEAFGPEHLETAAAINNHGVLLEEEGRLAEARPLLERALRLREKLLGPNDPETGTTVNNLAVLLAAEGNYVEARPLYERALRIDELVDGPDHPRTALTLNNLASLLVEEAEYDRAGELFRRALAIREKSLGPDHPDTVVSVANLAEILRQEERYAEAQPLFERAIGSFEKLLGPDSLLNATTIHNLALLHLEQGRCAQARPLFERALRIHEKQLSPRSREIQVDLHCMLMLCMDVGDRAGAAKLAERLAPLAVDSPDEALCARSDWERIQSMSRRFLYLETILSRPEPDDRPDAADRLAYDLVLRWKGAARRGLLFDHHHLLASLGVETQGKIERLRAVQSLLSNEVYRGAVEDAAALEKKLEALRSERGAIERDLALAIEKRSPPPPSVEALSKSLPERSVFVDLLVHRSYVPARREGDRVTKPGDRSASQVSAWVLAAGASRAVRVELGDAKTLQQAVAEFRDALKSERGAASLASSGESPFDVASRRLRALVWDRLAPTIGDAQLVIVSPDGFLGTIPFETIRLDDGAFLIEQRSFVYASSGGALEETLRSAPMRVPAAAGSTLVAGGIDYAARGDLASAGGGGEDVALAKERVGDRRGSFQSFWEPLPFTGKEARTVEALRRASTPASADPSPVVQTLIGGAATEENLKRSIAGKRFVHVATHGFFEPEGLPSMWGSALAEVERESKGRGPRDERRQEMGRVTGLMPGLLTGLVCSGANLPLEEGRDNGLLTAEEITWLDLTQCELVVLSACETGLGKDLGGQGVASLRAAFEAAGAKAVVASLWNVNDETTCDLMRDFYKRLWIDGRSRLEALRGAQLAMLERNRATNRGRSLPYTWGAFVLSGDWR